MNADYLYAIDEIGVKGLSLAEVEGNYPNWFSDLEVCAFNAHGAYPKTRESIKIWVESLAADPQNLVWAVYHKADGVHIGNIGLRIFNRIDNNAEIGFLFGEKTYWGRGLAAQAASLMLYHGFQVLNLHRIYCAVAENNSGMLRLAEKLGFTQEGRRRKNIFLRGEYWDEIEFGLLKHEYGYVPANHA